MILPAVIFPSNQKKASGKLEILFPLLGFSVIMSFLILALEVVKAKPSFSASEEQVLGFEELLPSLKPYPVNRMIYPPPELSAKSVFVMDADSSVILYQKDPDLRLLPASTTKMMTALVAFEAYPLDKLLVVDSVKVEGNNAKLLPGETLTVESLLSALLVGSANDAAEILSKNFPGGSQRFVSAMNNKALGFKLENTRFTNPIGFDEEGHYSTAKDLARLAVQLVKNPFLAKIVSLPEVTIKDVNDTVTHRLKNTNELVGKAEGVKGVKTGWTQNAGECLVAWVDRENKKVVIVVLGSVGRFEETTNLIKWVFSNFEWKVISP